MFDRIREDIRAVRQRDPAARSSFEILFLYSGVKALFWYRQAHWLHERGHFFLARWMSQHAKFTTGIEIHPGAKIGHGVFIDHGAGIVIGETAEVGDGCTLYQGCTLGGTGKDTGKRHPTLGKNVMVGSGAKILGPLTVGDNCKIASNAVLLHSIDADSTAVGVPAQVVRVKNVKQEIDRLDHVHIPDPVQQELCRVYQEMAKLQRRVEELEGKSPAVPAPQEKLK